MATFTLVFSIFCLYGLMTYMSDDNNHTSATAVAIIENVPTHSTKHKSGFNIQTFALASARKYHHKKTIY